MTPPPTPPPSHHQSREDSAGPNLAHAFGLTASDLFADLTWPALLKSAGLAVHLHRLIVGILIAFAVVSLDRLVAAIGNLEPLVDLWLVAIWETVESFSFANIHEHGFMATVFVPYFDTFAIAPWRMVLVAVPMGVIEIIGLAAISRMAAEEYCLDRSMGAGKGLGFAFDRVVSIIVSQAGAWLIMAGLMLVLAAGTWLLMGIPFVRFLGVMGFGLILIGAMTVCLLAIGAILATPLFSTAVVCEGTDGVDGISRGLAIVAGRPGRLIWYSLILLVQGVVVCSIAFGVALGTRWISAETAGWVAGPEISAMILGAGSIAETEVPVEISHWVRLWLGFWGLLPLIVALGFLYSFYGCASTMLYLTMRRHVDGQDTSELWVPGQAEAEAAMALELRHQAMQQDDE